MKEALPPEDMSLRGRRGAETDEESTCAPDEPVDAREEADLCWDSVGWRRERRGWKGGREGDGEREGGAEERRGQGAEKGASWRRGETELSQGLESAVRGDTKVAAGGNPLPLGVSEVRGVKVRDEVGDELLCQSEVMLVKLESRRGREGGGWRGLGGGP